MSLKLTIPIQPESTGFSLLLFSLLSLKKIRNRAGYYGFIICLLSGCFHPPYNQFTPPHPIASKAATGATAGAAVGAIATGTLPGTLVGSAVGGVSGALLALSKNTKLGLIKQLSKEDIQFVQYGDTMTLIVPVDKYFMFASPRLNESRYPGLNHIVALLKFYPQSPVYVAGFTDNVGSDKHKKLMSQAQAETMLSFLWANNIQAEKLKAIGYADQNDRGDNKFIHGSSFNRRIEIQWLNGIDTRTCSLCRQNTKRAPPTIHAGK